MVQISRNRLVELDEEIGKAQQDLERQQNAIEVGYRGDRISFFFDSRRLESQLRETLRVLELSDEDYTLLPQSLLQADVERNFATVPSPYGDF